MERRTLSLAAAALLATAPAGLASTQAEMEQLITFLQSRIATEDPTLTEALRYRALLESLEMMGVTVPPALRQAAPKDPQDLAKVLTKPSSPGAPPPARPAGVTVVEAANPFEAVPPAGSPRPSRPQPPAPSPAPEEVEPGLTEVGPDPVIRDGSASVSPPAVAPPRGAAQRVPAPQQVRSPRAYSMPPIARLARELLTNPENNPWKPVPKPVSQDRASPLGPAPTSLRRAVQWRAPVETARMTAAAPAATPDPSAPSPGIRERLRQLLGARAAAPAAPARAEATPRRGPASIRDLRAKARAAVAAAAAQAGSAPAQASPPAAPDLLSTSALQEQADSVLEALREQASVPPPTLGLGPGPGGAGSLGASATLPAPPRVAVGPGSQVTVTSPGGAPLPLGEGRHTVAWNSSVAVHGRGRAMVVYPSQGTIFRLQGGAEGRLEAGGIRRLAGSVERFLGRPDDGLTVLDQVPGAVPGPDVALGAPGLPRLELPAGTQASVSFDGLARSLGPGHHVIDWNSLVRLVEGDSARIVYPVTEKVYNFTGSAEGYVETTGVRPRSGQIQSGHL